MILTYARYSLAKTNSTFEAVTTSGILPLVHHDKRLMARIAAIVTEVQPHPGVKSVKSARADREKAFKEKHSRVDFLMQGFFQYYN